MPAEERRVVVTGLGAVTDLGVGAGALWSGLCESCSGISTITAFEHDDDWSTIIAGEASDFDPESVMSAPDARKADRACQFGMSAAVEAAADSGIDFDSGDPYRRGVAIGSGIGGILTIESQYERLLQKGPRRLSPFVVPKLMVNATAGQVSIRLNLRGCNTAVATACATGGHALADASMMIQRGMADVMLAGGCEAAVSKLCIAAFSAMKALSTRNDSPETASRPFDRDRDGFVLAEGAAVLVLEELEHAKARDARIYAELLGFGITGDAHHIAAPDPEGTGAGKALEFALASSGLNPEQVGYINAHGTSTPLGDSAEVTAVKRVFGDHAASLAISSTKSMTGHALGAAGGIESVASVLALHHGVLPPTINLDNPDEGMDLDFVPHVAREKQVDAVINNTFGFGGHNVSLVFKRW
ncbi:MAG: beta-ketoacyl-ACP synthase II [Phycisphaerales bacterium]|jgi:3-oxoacyl-[acyl-carrier-protein] synthase II|nr:beta-ketoacyl-ACP synthase II [Phycisphaerales bacterium]MDP6311453.1 beta-ketoacyl-ACP synthase II [Phycisphaerales bacterium]MDP7087282.1 beta-ketoacyl-ACP synthase II [Phycisphaerales bacterium]MDP7188940.1 beta-ketoacyl-ACP synthase II [Phycisphaerales bacterium]MDP7519225.1 beta-ketoacyl-ACP synthase II [Phycisphaerales bacterium]